jgi:hypothetical protein
MLLADFFDSIDHSGLCSGDDAPSKRTMPVPLDEQSRHITRPDTMRKHDR